MLAFGGGGEGEKRKVVKKKKSREGGEKQDANLEKRPTDLGMSSPAPTSSEAGFIRRRVRREARK